MSNIRLFFPESLTINFEGKLDKSQSHYLLKVMRIENDKPFSLFNASGEWEAVINEVSKSIINFKVTKQLRQKENTKEIWLAFSPIKSNYQNFMIQKATELGVTKFLPIIFDRSIVRKINNERFKKIIIEACEQSNRINLPDIIKTQTLDKFIYSNEVNLIFTDLNSENKKLDKNKFDEKPICVLVGPEGDFSEEEREKILKYKSVCSIKINDNILRSETAVISSLSIVNYAIS
ncbi:16S rRNA (uracil(1498)-N(3))-methyltransferase [Candidatus Pelagibacter sp.]|nr:16S rRNA (uracil(1498)-N(3))-methyltransferase [Candidatus Pelagibacter sp.]